MDNRNPNQPSQSLSTLSPISQYYQASDLAVPSLGHSIFNRVSEGVIAPAFGVLSALKLTNPGDAQLYHTIRQVIDKEESSPLESSLQSGSAQAAGFVTSLLNPISLATAEFGGMVAAGGSRLLGNTLPGAVSRVVNKPLDELLGESALVPKKSLAEIGKRKATAAGIGAGVVLPEELAKNIDEKTGEINYRGVVKGTAAGGGLALGLDAIPYFYGIFRGKFKAATGKSIESLPDEQAKVKMDELIKNGTITPEEAKWYEDYKLDSFSDSMAQRASKMLMNDGHPVDTARGRVMQDILKPEDMKNLNVAVHDQLSANLTNERNSLSDFIFGSKLEELRKNPSSLNGIEGVIDAISKHITAKKPLPEFDFLNAAIKENLPLSQKNLMKLLKKSEFEVSHTEHFPAYIPEIIKKRIEGLEKISNLEAKLKKEKRKGIEPNKQTIKRIADLENKLPKVQTPKEELHDIKSRLIKSEGLIDGFQNSTAYHRLADLAKVWENANKLLEHIHSEAEYKAQGSYRDLLQFMSNVVKSNFDKLADPKKIVDYMKARIDDRLPTEIKDQLKIEDVEKGVKSVPENVDEVLDEASSRLQERNAPDSLSKDFELASNRVKEFKKSEGSVFKNLISCVMGSINA